MSKYVIIIDNGETYSDHCHWTVATTDTEERAKSLVSEINSWIKKYSDIRNNLPIGDRYGPIYLTALREKSGPAPVPMLDNEIGRYLCNYDAGFIEVPHYV